MNLIKFCQLSFLALCLLGIEVSAASTTFNSPASLCSYCKNILKPTQLKRAIHLAAGYLQRMGTKNGKFIYQINLNPKVKLKSTYNMLRHAGTMYALAMYEQKYPNSKNRELLNRAAQFLQTTIAPVPDREDLRAVWSYPDIINKKKPVQAKLGGTGLGLVALLSLEKIQPGTTSLEDLRKMGNFIRFMQKNDGSFYSKYIPSHGGKNEKWTSLFYPGEAALGLLMLYEKDPAPIWFQTATKALTYLARLRTGKTLVEADHWALLATAKWFSVNQNPFTDARIRQHAQQIVESILITQAQLPKTSKRFGGFNPDGRTTPTATRLEGLLAALTFLPSDQLLLRKLTTSATVQGLAFLRRAQIRSGQYAGAIPRIIQPFSKKRRKSNEPRATEVRIDYVQHALSAMLQFEQMFY